MNVNRFRFLSDTLAYAVGKTVYKYSRDSVVSVTPISLQVPGKFMLHQNYPNPFNPVTNIEFELPVSGFTVLKIYGVKGDEVKTLLNKELSAGTYRARFDAADLPGGVYFYRIISGEFSETKKMIIIK
jgi:hypothetical protein